MYKFLHFTNIALIVWLCLSIETNLLFTQENPHPNVIIIYTDGQGTIDVNCYGAKDLHTPNIDMLAKTGIMFTQFYAAAAVCSPSRASLLTGKTPLAAGLPGNASSKKGNSGFPTILDFSGISYDENEFEGKSLRQVISKNELTSHKAFRWWDTHKRWAVRKGDWKLLKNPIDPSKKGVLGKKDFLFLVNINENPDELLNVADKYPEKVEELIKEFNDWYKSVR